MPSLPVKDAAGNTVTVQTLPAVGQANAAASLPVALPSDMPPLPVTATALPLPTGAATDTSIMAIVTALAGKATDAQLIAIVAALATLHTDQATLLAKFPATLGAKTAATSLAVTLPTDQSALVVSAATLPLPSGAATDVNLTAVGNKLPATLGAKTTALSLAVALPTDQGPIPVSNATLPLPNGAATDASLTSLGNKLPSSLGAKTAATSLAVALATDANVPIVPPPATHSDRSGMIAAGGASQTLMAANAARRGFYIQNNSTGDLWISGTGSATLASPSLRIPSGALYESPYGSAGVTALNIIGATTNQAFTAREW